MPTATPRLYSPSELRRIEALEAVMRAHRALRDMQRTLGAHEARCEVQRGAILQLIDERYANLCDALDVAEKSGIVPHNMWHE